VERGKKEGRIGLRRKVRGGGGKGRGGEEGVGRMGHWGEGGGLVWELKGEGRGGGGEMEGSGVRKRG